MELHIVRKLSRLKMAGEIVEILRVALTMSYNMVPLMGNDRHAISTPAPPPFLQTVVIIYTRHQFLQGL